MVGADRGVADTEHGHAGVAGDDAAVPEVQVADADGEWGVVVVCGLCAGSGGGQVMGVTRVFA